MLEFIDENVGVEVRLRVDGTVLPLAFTWRGRHHRIESWGREEDELRDGCAVRCYLVQTAGPETWELCHDAGTGLWTLTRRWAAKHHPV